MEIILEFRIRKIYDGPVGMGVLDDAPSVTNRPLKNLLHLFNKEVGVEFNLPSSEREIGYDVERFGEKQSKTSLVPLDYPSRVADTIGYVFRNPNLEIVLKDYFKPSSERSLNGGDIHAEKGIGCKLNFQGTYKEGQVVEKARHVLEEFYGS